MSKKQKQSQRDWYSLARNEKTKSSELHIFGDIGEFFFSTEESVTAKKVVKELSALSDSGINDLTIRISSFGGSVTDGISIHNAIRRFPGSRTTEIETAYSIASYIAMAGDPGKIRMAENGMMMLHGPRSGTFGTANDQRTLADWLEKVQETMAPAYERDGLTKMDVRSILSGNENIFLNAQDAFEAGIIDEIGEVIPEQEISNQIAKASARFFDYDYNPRKYAVSAALTESEATEMPENEKGDQITPKEDQKDPEINVIDIQSKAERKTMDLLKERNSNIATAFAPFLAPDHPHYHNAQMIYNEAMANLDIPADEIKQKLLAKLGETLRPITPEGHSTAVILVEDGRDKIRNGIALALESRMEKKPLERGNQFRGQTLIQLATASLSASGIDTIGMTKREISERTFAVHTTSDFPQLLGDNANKRLQTAYENFPSTWESIAARSETNDFKTVNLVRMGAFSTLALKPPGKQYEQGTIGEEGEQVTVRTKGRYIDFTREMLINDDLSGFDRLVTMMGRASARTINKDVYSVINSNPIMSDGVALYDAAHGNLAGSGTVISVDSIGARRSAMRLQSAPDQPDEHLDIMPAVLTVPVVLEDHARTVVTSTTNTDDTGALAMNIIRQWSPLQVVSDPELDNTSAIAWYLFANPMDVPALEVVFLEGEMLPYMEPEEVFLSDVMRWKVRHDVGVTANDWRGTQKNPGA